MWCDWIVVAEPGLRAERGECGVTGLLLQSREFVLSMVYVV